MKNRNERKEEKRQAVVARLKEHHNALDILSNMWDEKTLDALILAFGLGHVELDQ